MILPIALILLATLAACVVAYGADARWVSFEKGLSWIIFAWRFDWLFIGLCLIGCLGLAGVVAAGRHRVIWLGGLIPVLLILSHRFQTPAIPATPNVDRSEFLTIDKASNLSDSDPLAVIRFADQVYGYPLAQLSRTPVLVQTDQTQRMVLLWSRRANRLLAWAVKLDVHAADLKTIGEFGNATFIYHSHYGQVINSVSGLALDGLTPRDFVAKLHASQMTWGQFKTAYPKGLVLSSDGPGEGEAAPDQRMPGGDAIPLPPAKALIISTTQPAVMPMPTTRASAMNVVAGKVPILLISDDQTGRLRGFIREVQPDMPAIFVKNTDPRLKGALFDKETHSGWNLEGTAVDGPCEKEHRKLTPIPLEQGVNWDVVRYWSGPIEPAVVRK